MRLRVMRNRSYPVAFLRVFIDIRTGALTWCFQLMR